MIGRETELATLTGLLFDPTVRILTLTGPAGVGKSRLAHAAAARSVLSGRVAAVDLSSLDTSAAAWREIATQLGMTAPQADDSLPEDLADRIGGRELLLILDNCDLIAAQLSLDIARLSARCSGLRLLLTSRVSLDIYAERLFPVRPFPVPTAASSPLSNPESPAVRLFMERARAHRPHYALPEEDVDVIRDICAALDGLPLAIELGAGAVGMLGPRALLTQLRRGEWPASSRLLDRPARHRTVDRSLSWGDPVLTREHRHFLQQLTVCEGQFDLATAQRVAGLSWPQMMRHLETLVHMSLLQRVERADGDIGFRMLHVVRNYYLRHQPPVPAELARARDRHADHFADMAAAAQEKMRETSQAQWLPAVRWRMGDFRAAIAHFQSRGDHHAAARTLLALDVALEDLSGLPDMLDHLVRSIGHLEKEHRDDPEHRTLLARSLETAAAWSLTLGPVLQHGRGIGELLTCAGAVYQSLADPAGAARTVAHQAEWERRTNRLGPAGSHAAAAIAELDRLGDRRGAAAARRTLALITFARTQTHTQTQTRSQTESQSRIPARAENQVQSPDQGTAEAHLLRALDDLHSAGASRARAVTLTDLARVLTAAGRPDQAYAAVREAMELLREAGGPRQVTRALETAARVLPHIAEGQQHRAARLLLTAQVLREHHRLPVSEDAPQLNALRDELRSALGESTLTELRRQVTGTGPLAALNDALSAPPTTLRASTSNNADVPALEALTPRQSQIARMVADGLTNRQIARSLELSEWTVINHLRHVMQKLNCPSRVHVARLVQQAAAPSHHRTAANRSSAHG
ncbi:LuxR C-terminal-related transcriptional regulator [Streptomyces sp. NPDC051569]|uniref:LuxR C-terminal-related transcriptional regulator n=1 Tax=Streptomyces sp. NPDC051569 TaxID=3365661 RepID=UPI0037B3674D